VVSNAAARSPLPKAMNRTTKGVTVHAHTLRLRKPGDRLFPSFGHINDAFHVLFTRCLRFFHAGFGNLFTIKAGFDDEAPTEV